MFEGELRQRANRLYQILQATVSREVADYGHAPLRTIPESIKDANVLLRGAEALPVSDPSFEHLANLSITNRYLLDAVDFETGPVEHLLNRAAC